MPITVWMRRTLATLSIAAGLVGAATPALAATHTRAHLRAHKRPYVTGSYVGKVSQSVPQAYSGWIGFQVRAGRLTRLQFKVTMVCGKLLMTQVQSPPNTLQVKLARDGSFSYAGALGGAVIHLQGKVHGRGASGTFFESFATTPQFSCTMYQPAPFGAGPLSAGSLSAGL